MDVRESELGGAGDRVSEAPSRSIPSRSQGPSIISILFAFICGFFCWGVSLLFLSPGNPLGTVDGSTILVFFGPTLFFFAPWALRALTREEFEAAIWLVAIAPIGGVANFVALLVLAVVFGLNGNTTTLLLSIAWVLPLLSLLIGKK